MRLDVKRAAFRMSVPGSLTPENADLGGYRIGFGRLEGVDERTRQLLQCQTSTVATAVGNRGLDHGTGALFANPFGPPHHHVRIRDLLPNSDAAGPAVRPRLETPERASDSRPNRCRPRPRCGLGQRLARRNTAPGCTTQVLQQFVSVFPGGNRSPSRRDSRLARGRWPSGREGKQCVDLRHKIAASVISARRNQRQRVSCAPQLGG